MAPSELQEALPSLSSIAYENLPSNLGEYLQSVFHHAETIINSIPPPPSTSNPSPLPPSANLAKTPEDTICHPYPSNEIDARHTATQAAWGKPVKTNAKENPLGIAVFKMSGHDKNGAWFARRSIHLGLGFTRWKSMMQREFGDEVAETGGPGAGAVRGITADRRIEKHEVEGVGQLEVYQLSAQFPGPVAPREFETLLHTSSSALSSASALQATGAPPRHFMVVSRPTQHPDAPPRPDLVLGTYESIEMIRELPKAEQGADPETNPVEWIMITRSDPGGGIPRFMVERGTPGSVVADTSKFLKWALSRGDAAVGSDETAAQTPTKAVEPERQQDGQQEPPLPEQAVPLQTSGTTQPAAAEAAQGGFMSILTGNFEAAVATVAPSYLPTVQHAIGTDTTGEDVGAESDASDSEAGYTSAEESLTSSPRAIPSTPANRDRTTTISSMESSTSIARPASTTSTTSPSSKLAQKHAAIDAKLAKLSQDHEKKMKEIQNRDLEHTTKEQEKMEKERRKQEEKLHKEKQKLEEQAVKDAEKADKEAKKAEEKRAKEVAKEEERAAKEAKKEEERRAKELSIEEIKQLKAELDKHKKRADEAEKEVEVLRKQVAELQHGQKQEMVQEANASSVSLKDRTGTLVIG